MLNEAHNIIARIKHQSKLEDNIRIFSFRYIFNYRNNRQQDLGKEHRKYNVIVV